MHLRILSRGGNNGKREQLRLSWEKRTQRANRGMQARSFSLQTANAMAYYYGGC